LEWTKKTWARAVELYEAGKVSEVEESYIGLPRRFWALIPTMWRFPKRIAIAAIAIVSWAGRIFFASMWWRWRFGRSGGARRCPMKIKN